MKYCKSCVLPSTRPNLFILPNGNCTACETHAFRPKIAWGKMKLEFKNIIKNIKKKKLLYDCLIPVSGGKDSTWQVILAKKMVLILLLLLINQ